MSNKNNFFSIEGEINNHLKEKVLNFLKPFLKQKNQEIIFKINSEGGNLESLRRIKTYMYFLAKKCGHSFTCKLIYAESAAFLLFLNCNVREVSDDGKGSVGIIHLPVPNRDCDPKKLERERSDQASFIFRRSGYKVPFKEVFKLEGKKMKSDELISFGFATKKVKSFT
ncbi:hypothetical protein IT402_00785 [Candidatus Nomurabacteria bacterium]|nr:hypothetical protein [Candidatus Nomurabacteria bacterium]